MKARALVAGIVSLLAGCSGGGDGTPAVHPDGIVFGTITRGATSTAIQGFVSDGRLMLADRTARVFYDVPFDVHQHDIASAAVRVYATDSYSLDFIRGYTELASLDGTIQPGQSLGATITRPGGTETLDLAYDVADYATDAAFTMSTWVYAWTSNGSATPYATTLQTAGDGTSVNTNNLNNCTGNGVTTIPNAHFNLYSSTVTFSGSGCQASFGGTFTGLSTVAGTGSPGDIMTAFSTNDTLFVYSDFARQ